MTSCLRYLAVVVLIGLLGPHGCLGDGGQGRAGYTGRLHDLNVFAGQASDQLLTGGAGCEKELVGHAGQH